MVSVHSSKTLTKKGGRMRVGALVGRGGGGGWEVGGGRSMSTGRNREQRKKSSGTEAQRGREGEK